MRQPIQCGIICRLLTIYIRFYRSTNIVAAGGDDAVYEIYCFSWPRHCANIPHQTKISLNKTDKSPLSCFRGRFFLGFFVYIFKCDLCDHHHIFSRMFENHLIGELVLEGEAPELDEAEWHSSAVAVIEHVTNKMDQIRKREERIKQTLNSLHFVEATSSGSKRDSSGEILIQSSDGKKPRLNVSGGPDQSDGTDLISSEAKLRRLDTSELFDQEIVERYAEFMLPNEYDHDAPESVQHVNVVDQETDVVDEPVHGEHMW